MLLTTSTFRTPSVALFMRGDEPRHLGRIDTVEAGAVIIDFEDAVDPTSKPEAHRLTSEVLQARASASGDASTSGRSSVTRRVWVRINEPGQFRGGDLDAAAWPGVEALVVPKIEGPGDIHEISAALDTLERDRDVSVGSIGIIGQVETPRGFQRLSQLDVEETPRLRTLAFGPADYCARLDLPVVSGSPALEYARAALVQGTRAAGLAAPLDGPWLDLGEPEAMDGDSRLSLSHGFGGRLSIYPGHVSAMRAIYEQRVTVEEVERARAIVQAWEARPSGAGTALVGDIFIDPPVFRRAMDVLVAAGER